MNLLAIIPARGNSVRLPRKNFLRVLDFHSMNRQEIHLALTDSVDINTLKDFERAETMLKEIEG